MSGSTSISELRAALQDALDDMSAAAALWLEARAGRQDTGAHDRRWREAERETRRLERRIRRREKRLTASTETE